MHHDLELLYSTHAARLRQIVGACVRAPDPVLDDACQVAWSRFIRRTGAVRSESILAWLVTTASREAIKMSRRLEREQPLESLSTAAAGLAGRSPGADELAEQRARLAEIGSLPRRQQELIWLHGLGFSYAEMAQSTGASPRTVERQLERARQRLRAA